MKLLSAWGEKLNRDCPLNEYPRMQLQRDSYTCLNGVWQFQITDGAHPSSSGWEDIVVPFALGSRLSGTKKHLEPGQVLWYRKYFSYALTPLRTFLNFEAVDQCCEVWLNGFSCGHHEGGYEAFSFDVTGRIKPQNELIVRVTDDSDHGIYAYGKQKTEHSGMWYTPSSGIWQTVWLEDVPMCSVDDIKITPDYDRSVVYVQMKGSFDQAVVTVFEGKKLVHRSINASDTCTIPLKNMHPWTPEDPFLYDLYIQTEDETVKSYFGMRRFTVEKDEDGYPRFCLNHKPVFLSGLLDQGYISDGLMTWPDEQAVIYELGELKKMGFNMLRKHIKVESRRWYYLCDKIGMLVMQDMPSGGGPYDFFLTAVKPTLGNRTIPDHDYEKFGRTSAESRAMYLRELDAMMNQLYNCTSIFAWVPFNEGWGQFDSEAVTARIREYDSTRLVDSASGWHDQGAGDFDSRHVYFTAFKTPKSSDGRALLLSEFGGYAYMEYGHSEAKKLYGYKKYKDKLKLNDAVMHCYEKNVLANIPKGLCGCIYTQVSDVEDECNGLFTYDRKVLKIDKGRMRRMNEKLKGSLK
ncbi:MAG: glycoside hydrolase family 2 [Solobacterium sp.]|nr:glycoside hydrolase family 2 [Solobacterium sp.]